MTFPSLARAAPGAALALVLVAAGALIFTNLGNRYLWDDEAETALLARNVLRFGVPLGWDGRQLISQLCAVELDENYLSRWHGWLPVYLTAASFTLFGAETGPARLPFAVLGWLAVLSLPALAYRVVSDRGTAVLAAALLTVCVPFLLHVRQARYYALAIFAATWILYFFFGLLEGRPSAVGGLVLALTLMVHANTPMFAATGLALAIAALVAERPGRAIVRLAVAGGAALLVNAPWVGRYGAPWTVSFGADWSHALASAADNFFDFYLARLDRYVVPLALPAAIGAGLLIARRRPALNEPATRRALILSAFVLAYLAAVAVYPEPYFRYAATLLPALMVLLAAIVRWLWRARPTVAAVAVLLIVTTDVLHGWVYAAVERFDAPGVRSPLLEYVGEITSDVDGPIEAIVRYVKEKARPGEQMFITYGDLPLRFYTDLEVRGGQSCEGPTPGRLPDWIVIRGFLRVDSPVRQAREDALRTQDYLARVVPWHAYERVTLPVLETLWENNPEPGVHLFRPPATGRPVVIHRKIRPTGSSARDGS